VGAKFNEDLCTEGGAAGSDQAQKFKKIQQPECMAVERKAQDGGPAVDEWIELKARTRQA
jgi:hypothetical protein